MHFLRYEQTPALSAEEVITRVQGRVVAKEGGPMPSRRKYFGDAYVKKDWRGPRAGNLCLTPQQAHRLAGALEKGVAAAAELDLAIYPAKGAGHEARITVNAPGA